MMETRMMPGLIVAAILAVSFGWAELPPDGRETGIRQEAETFAFAEDGMAAPQEFFTFFSASAKETGFRAASPVPPSAAAKGGAAPGTRLPAPPPFPASSGKGKSSETAYASIASGDAAAPGYADPLDIPSGDPPPFLLDFRPQPPSSRGLRAFASGGILRARQNPDFFTLDNSAYSMTGETASLGLQYDWSPDAVLGASVEKLSVAIQSRHPHDTRETRTGGLLAHLSLDAVLFNSSLLRLRGFYGALDHEGDGSLGDGSSASAWREHRHSSRMHGLSAAFSLPLLFWDHRVVVDSGVDYRHIKTDPYIHEVQGAGGLPPGEGFSSRSLAFSSFVSMERDFLSHWGLVTLRAGAGYARETSRTAGGVRSLNALAAVPMPYRPLGFGGMVFSGPPSKFLCAWSGMYHVNAGLDFQSPGGWNWSVAYRREFSAAYSGDALKLEVGRSF